MTVDRKREAVSDEVRCRLEDAGDGRSKRPAFTIKFLTDDHNGGDCCQFCFYCKTKFVRQAEDHLNMHKLSFHDALHAGRLFRLLTIGALALLAALACPGAAAWAQTAERRTDPAIRPEFREPVTLASKEGVLEVRLTARQGQATLDTVSDARPELSSFRL